MVKFDSVIVETKGRAVQGQDLGKKIAYMNVMLNCIIFIYYYITFKWVIGLV